MAAEAASAEAAAAAAAAAASAAASDAAAAPTEEPTRPRAKDPYALFRLVATGDAAAVRYALGEDAALRAQLNRSDRNGSTPLFFCVWRGDAAMCAELLRAGADPNWRNARGRTPLYMAVEKSRAPLVALLLQAGAKGSWDLANELRAATGKEIAHDVDAELLRHCPPPAGADVAKAAEQSRKRQRLRAREQARGAKAAPAEVLINAAAKRSDCEELARLLEENREHAAELVNWTDRNGSSAIFHCAWTGREDVALLLLQYGADLNVRNLRDNTALHLAIEKNHFHLCRLFLEHGADTLGVSVREIRRRTGREISRKVDRLVRSYPPLTEQQREMVRVYQASGYARSAEGAAIVIPWHVKRRQRPPPPKRRAQAEASEDTQAAAAAADAAAAAAAAAAASASAETAAASAAGEGDRGAADEQCEDDGASDESDDAATQQPPQPQPPPPTLLRRSSIVAAPPALRAAAADAATMASRASVLRVAMRWSPGWTHEQVCEWLVQTAFARWAPRFRLLGVGGMSLVSLTSRRVRAELGVEDERAVSELVLAARVLGVQWLEGCAVADWTPLHVHVWVCTRAPIAEAAAPAAGAEDDTAEEAVIRAAAAFEAAAVDGAQLLALEQEELDLVAQPASAAERAAADLLWSHVERLQHACGARAVGDGRGAPVRLDSDDGDEQSSEGEGEGKGEGESPRPAEQRAQSERAANPSPRAAQASASPQPQPQPQPQQQLQLQPSPLSAQRKASSVSFGIGPLERKQAESKAQPPPRAPSPPAGSVAWILKRHRAAAATATAPAPAPAPAPVSAADSAALSPKPLPSPRQQHPSAAAAPHASLPPLPSPRAPRSPRANGLSPPQSAFAEDASSASPLAAQPMPLLAPPPSPRTVRLAMETEMRRRASMLHAPAPAYVELPPLPRAVDARRASPKQPPSPPSALGRLSAWHRSELQWVFEVIDTRGDGFASAAQLHAFFRLAFPADSEAATRQRVEALLAGRGNLTAAQWIAHWSAHDDTEPDALLDAYRAALERMAPATPDSSRPLLFFQSFVDDKEAARRPP